MTHWTESLFVDGADAYLPALKAAGERAEAEAEVVANLFGEQGVPANGRVLDVACGLGRHSVPLARRGYDVTGVDISPTFVGRARERAEEAGADASFVVGDMRDLRSSLRPDAEFDAFMQMFTSNGYYGRSGDLRLYLDLHAMAAPNAVLLVTTTNRDWLLTHFEPELSEESGGVVHLQSVQWGQAKATIEADWGAYKVQGEKLEPLVAVHMDLRVYNPGEIAELLEQAGWTVDHVYGSERSPNFTLQEVSPDLMTMWVVARA
jgi:2-polyprenyl-3-methyl-5-hydroxy-6-metoxy-1,4-benzoquinol methylase